MRELREARRALRERERIHDNFLRMISHELRTPIASMELTIRLIERDPAVQRSEKLRTGVERIASGSRRLHQLVATMTEWNRIQGGRREMQPSSFALGPAVERAVEGARSHAERKDIHIECHIQHPMGLLTSDRELVELLIANLVTRAVQFSKDGTVTVRASQSSGEHLVELHDTADALRSTEQLFDPLRSPTELLRRCGCGSGLALSVLDDLTRAVGGTLSLRPGRQKGNTAIVRLPAFTGGALQEES